MAKKKKETEEAEEESYIDKVKLDRFIVLMYNFNSENRKKYQDYMERKKECAIQAGFEFDETFEPEVEEMLFGQNDTANRLIIDYVISLGSPDLTRYVAFQQMLSTQVTQSMRETDEKSVKVVRENINNISEDLKEIEVNLFGGSDQSLRKSLYASMVDKLRLRPEHVAKDIADKNLKIKDVYYD